jgi:hypothetical protein
MTDDAHPESGDATPDEEGDAHRLAVKEELMAFYERSKALHASGRGIPVENPEKYDFPIGLDNEGKPFPVPAKGVDDEGKSSPEPT